MSKSFTELAITADEQLKEQLVGILSQIGFEGFWEDDLVLRCYISAERWNPAILDEVQRIAATVQRSSGSVAPVVSLHQVESKNWNEEWEKTIEPIHVTKHIVIAPTWHHYAPAPGELLITIDPKMSFGTGYHESTRLVLQLMEEAIKPGMRVLDVGTGTGVLAIAAVKLGASTALGIDNDEWAFENALENITLNRVEEDVTIVQGEFSSIQSKPFDMIVANIQRNVIEPLLSQMNEMLPPGGVMILSGLLLQDEEPICLAVRATGCDVAKTLKENEWVALLVKKELE